MATLPSILLIDPDPQLAASIQSSPSLGGVSFAVSTAEAAPGLISDAGRTWIAVVLFAGAEPAETIEVIHLCHSRRAGVPIVVASLAPDSLLLKCAKDLGISVMDRKPSGVADIMANLNVDPQALDFKAATGSSAGAIPDAYFPGGNLFWPGIKLTYAVFIRISATKMLKVLHEGDSFSAEQMQGYISKGVGCFYLSKAAQAGFILACEKLSADLKRPAAAEPTQGAPEPQKPEEPKEKVQQTMQSGEKIMKVLATQGLTEENVEAAERFTQELGSLVQRIDTSKNDVIKSFLSNVADFEHGVGTSVIASLLAQSCGILSEKFASVVGLAALFHDVGLLQLPAEYRDEDESRMTEAQKKKFYTHPMLGREALGKIRGIFPVTLQAIEQHHERFDKTGFPLGIGTTKITKLSEIIGLSALFQRVIHKAQETGADPIEVMVKSHLKHFSQPVRDGFMTVFGKEAVAKEAPAAQ